MKNSALGLADTATESPAPHSEAHREPRMRQRKPSLSWRWVDSDARLGQHHKAAHRSAVEP